MRIKVRFKFAKETRAALRYEEVDENGQVIQFAWAKIGSLYVRKSALELETEFPQFLRITIDTAPVPAGN